MEKTIFKVMDEEHQRIEGILERFENLGLTPAGTYNNSIDFEKARRIFDEFKWNLQKHLFVEEKAIFDVCSSDCGSKIPEIFELMQEHGEILELIKEIENNLSINVKPDISKIKDFLEKHIDFEEEKFYPMLDKELSPEAKHEIFKRTEEILWR